MAMKFLVLAMPVTCLARLGVPTNSSSPETTSRFHPSPEDLLPGGKARGAEYWENFTVGEDDNSTLRSGYYHNPSIRTLLGVMKSMGYDHIATSTRYGDTCCASCGSVNTAELVKGTGFYAVASAESMQANGIGDGHYCTSSAPDQGDTVGMGCLSCARGKFLKAHPFSYPLWAQPRDQIFNKEIKIVVADTCPHTGNEGWCPGKANAPNKFGIKNHFDFTDPPPKYDNYYFVWSKMPCPSSIKRRYHQLSRC
eukprot:Skav227320  [mRNA]  locus=scaffold4402:77511:78269:- [translate_table: standard]